MNIREAIPSDIPELMIFYNRMCDILGERDFLPDGSRECFPSQRMVEAAIAQGGQLIGTEDGAIVAALILNHDCDPAYEKGAWQVDAVPQEVSVLHALRVLPEYAGRGYSRRLMEYALDNARRRGQRAIRLDCIEGNDIPVKMYLSLGFRYAGTVPITYEDIGFPMPFRLYELIL